MDREPITLTNIPVRVSGKIKDVLNIYEKYHVPRMVLMRDYLAVINYRDRWQEALNPWLYFHKGVLKENVEEGMSVSETVFETGAMQLLDKKPTEVIRASFYKRRNDSGLECGLVLPEYVSMLESNDDTLIINPSPDMIIRFEEAHPAGTHYYVVNDQTIADLYHIEFPEAVFLRLGAHDSEKINIQNALITTRDANTEAITQMFDMCADFNPKKVLAVLPNKYIDNRDNKAFKVFQNANLHLNKVLLLDNGTTMTMPKKKSMVLLINNAVDNWELETSTYDKETHTLSFDEKTFVINSDDFWHSGKTLIDLRRISSKPKQHEEKYSKSHMYEFSPEISLNYAVYEDRGKLAGAAWYCQLIDPDTGRRANRVTLIIKKGLRVNNDSELTALLDIVALDERVEPYIQHDIEEYYANAGKHLSLKTLWLCCRNFAGTVREYEDERIVGLFLNQHSDLCNMIIDESCSDIFVTALSRHLDSDVDDIPIVMFQQFNILFGAAVKLGYLGYNPLTPLMPDLQKRASRRQQDVRNVLTKKHFTADEEDRIVSFLKRTDSKTDGFPLCISNSIWLVGAIRLFSGVALREAGALTWDDFDQIAETGFYNLKIYKFLDNRGHIQSHAAREDWKRYRLVPCASVLSKILLMRKDYLYSKGFKENDFSGLPIIMSNERYSEIKKGKNLPFCKPSRLAEYCRRLISVAEIPERILILPDADQELSTDIYQYNGDIFLSNLRMHLNHECGFTLGEIAYITGVNPPDTFSRYYCDYSADLVQYAMAKKMSRWTSKYSDLKQDGDPGKILQNKPEFISGPFSTECAELDMGINIGETGVKDSLVISVDAQNGYKIEINKYSGES